MLKNGGVKNVYLGLMDSANVEARYIFKGGAKANEILRLVEVIFGNVPALHTTPRLCVQIAVVLTGILVILTLYHTVSLTFA